MTLLIDDGIRKRRLIQASVGSVISLLGMSIVEATFDGEDYADPNFQEYLNEVIFPRMIPRYVGKQEPYDFCI